MKKLLFAGLLPFCLSLSCMGQAHQPPWPKHIEPPTYPHLAVIGRVSGKVELTVAIDSDGRVTDVKVTNEDERFVKTFLEKAAVENIRRWTFTKPETAPAFQNVTYVFQIDKTLPVTYPNESFVEFDLPDRVTVRTNLPVAMP